MHEWDFLLRIAREADGVTLQAMNHDQGQSLVLMREEKACTLRMLQGSLHVFCGVRSYALPEPFWSEESLQQALDTCVEQLHSPNTMSPQTAYDTLVDRLAPFHGVEASRRGRSSEFRYYYPEGSEPPYASTRLTSRVRSYGRSMLLVHTRTQAVYMLSGMVDRIMLDIIACYVVSPMMGISRREPWMWPLGGNLLQRAYRILYQATSSEVRLEHRQASDNQAETIVAQNKENAPQVFLAQQTEEEILWCWKENESASAFVVPDSIALLWVVVPFILSPTPF